MATPPVFLPGESHGQRSLAGYSPQGCKELDMTEATKHLTQVYQQQILSLFIWECLYLSLFFLKDSYKILGILPFFSLLNISFHCLLASTFFQKRSQQILCNCSLTHLKVNRSLGDFQHSPALLLLSASNNTPFLLSFNLKEKSWILTCDVHLY